MRRIFRIIKRDEGHDPGADKGECRNLSVETWGSCCLLQVRESRKSPDETKVQRGHGIAAVLEFCIEEPIALI